MLISKTIETVSFTGVDTAIFSGTIFLFPLTTKSHHIRIISNRFRLVISFSLSTNSEVMISEPFCLLTQILTYLVTTPFLEEKFTWTFLHCFVGSGIWKYRKIRYVLKFEKEIFFFHNIAKLLQVGRWHGHFYHHE